MVCPFSKRCRIFVALLLVICSKELENHEVIQPLFYSPVEKISLIK